MASLLNVAAFPIICSSVFSCSFLLFATAFPFICRVSIFLFLHSYFSLLRWRALATVDSPDSIRLTLKSYIFFNKWLVNVSGSKIWKILKNYKYEKPKPDPEGSFLICVSVKSGQNINRNEEGLEAKRHSTSRKRGESLFVFCEPLDIFIIAICVPQSR